MRIASVILFITYKTYISIIVYTNRKNYRLTSADADHKRSVT